MTDNKKFFDMKATEAGFDLNDSDERKFVGALHQLVHYVIHGEDIQADIDDMTFCTYTYSEAVAEVTEDLSNEYLRYTHDEECFILFSIECEFSFQVAYLLNQFGIELVYRNGDYRVYIKK